MKLALKICGILLCTTGSAGQAGFSQEPPAAEKPVVLQGITYWKHGQEVFVPLRALAGAMGWVVAWDDPTQTVLVDDRPVSSDSLIRTPDSTAFIRLSSLPHLGVEMAKGKDDGKTSLWTEKKTAILEVPEQQVEVSLNHQELRAWQGQVLIMRTNVSTGRRGYGTPSGQFRALSKARYRVSRKYNNAPMPFSVQVHGGVFIHGSGSVPRSPASHGCVRMPLTGGNAAREFFEWVNVGARITIVRDWSDEARAVIEGPAGTGEVSE